MGQLNTNPRSLSRFLYSRGPRQPLVNSFNLLLCIDIIIKTVLKLCLNVILFCLFDLIMVVMLY